MIVISVLVRRLREGKTYEDFREAWLPEQGFGSSGSHHRNSGATRRSTR